MGRKNWRSETTDVSRHGMFLLTPDPPHERFLVKLSIELPGGLLDATAFVSRRVEGDKSGVGVQFFALSSQAKGRWDAFISSLTGASSQEIHAAQSAAAKLPANSATFLIKLRDVDRMIDFFEKKVRTGSVQMTTPLLRDVGAPIALIMIHPESEREFMIQGKVTKVIHQPSKAMELQLEPISEKMALRFREFVATGTPTDTMDIKVHGEPPVPTGSEGPPAPTNEPLDDGRGSDGLEPESNPFTFEMNEATGDLSIDIEIDSEASEELETLADLPTPSSLDILTPPNETVAVRCTACGAYLGTCGFRELPEPLSWVAVRRVRYDRFAGRLEESVEPRDLADLNLEQADYEDRSITAGALFELARMWREHGAPDTAASDLSGALREAAGQLSKGKGQAHVDMSCPACGESSVFAFDD